jgi:hypothetical protein
LFRHGHIIQHLHTPCPAASAAYIFGKIKQALARGARLILAGVSQRGTHTMQPPKSMLLLQLVLVRQVLLFIGLRVVG